MRRFAHASGPGASCVVSALPRSPSSRPRTRRGTAADDQAQATAGDPQWPRVIEDGGVTFTIYQPQIDKFDDTVLEARAAVQVQTPVDDKTQTTYGVIWIKANTFIDKETGLVQLDDIQITKANFPTAGDKVDQYLDVFRRNAEQGAHDLAGPHRGQPRDRAGRQEGQRGPAQERPAADLLPHLPRDPDHDRRRPGPARRRGRRASSACSTRAA